MRVFMFRKIVFIILLLISSSCSLKNANAQDCFAITEDLRDFLNTKILINGNPGYLLSSAAIATISDPNVYLIAGELSFSNEDSREYSVAIWEINGLDSFDSIVSINGNASDYSEFPANVEKLFYVYSKDGSADLVKKCLFDSWWKHRIINNWGHNNWGQIKL